MYLFNKGIGWRIHSETMKATADSLNDQQPQQLFANVSFSLFHPNIDEL